jgi:hypothetical protein
LGGTVDCGYTVRDITELLEDLSVPRTRTETKVLRKIERAATSPSNVTSTAIETSPVAGRDLLS